MTRGIRPYQAVILLLVLSGCHTGFTVTYQPDLDVPAPSASSSCPAVHVLGARSSNHYGSLFTGLSISVSGPVGSTSRLLTGASLSSARFSHELSSMELVVYDVGPNRTRPVQLGEVEVGPDREVELALMFSDHEVEPTKWMSQVRRIYVENPPTLTLSWLNSGGTSCESRLTLTPRT